MTLAEAAPAPDELTARRLIALLGLTKEHMMETKPLRFPSGPRLREARKDAGISAEQVAITLGKTSYTVNGYEIGRIEPPVHVLVQMCQMFGVSVGDVLGESA